MSKHSSYFTYIVECADKSYYTGSTPDVIHRIKQHNGKLTGGARYTRTRRPVVLKYVEEYSERTEAIRRECAIKKLSHKEKDKLCQIKTKM